MAKTKRGVDIDTKSKRLALATGMDYMTHDVEYEYLIYHRSEKSHLAGSFIARCYIPETGKQPQKRLGKADDFAEADGKRILSYKQAKDLARAWFVELRKIQDLPTATESPEPEKPWTVARAFAAYMKDREDEGVQGIKIMQQTYHAHIRQQLGAHEIGKLTKSIIKNWHRNLAKQGRLRTGQRKRGEPAPDLYNYEPLPPPVPEPVVEGAKEPRAKNLPPPSSPEEKRQRRDSANRVLNNLKAALNYVFNEELVLAPAVWKLVKPFENVGKRRTRCLPAKEQVALVNACGCDLRPLVRAALFTGARYGELCKVKVIDFNLDQKFLYIAFGKGRKGPKPRNVMLTNEGIRFFTNLTVGRQSNEFMFIRTNALRGTRAGVLENPDIWASHDQKTPMDEACTKAGIDRVTFHELRHSYASYLLNKGYNLSYLAQQLGHADLRMVNWYYGHLAQPEMRIALDAIPDIGIYVPEEGVGE